MRVAITGAAGKTGLALATALRAVGADVTPLVRRPHGLPDERVAAFDDPRSIEVAISKVDAVYLIAPNVHPTEVTLLQPMIDACARRGTAVVYHSVMHPSASAMPHHLAKAQVEDRVRTSGAPWTVLQPASYFDNVIAPITSAADGVWRQPYSVHTRFTPIALDDIAEVAAAVLLDESHRYATYELAGAELLTSQDMARVAQRVLERPLTVVADRADWEKRVGAHLSPDAALRLGLMFDYYDRHGFAGNARTATSLLGRAPVSFPTWLQRHRDDLEAASVSPTR